MQNFDPYLKNAGSVAISGHVRPDGDCVGACLAVYNYIADQYPQIHADVLLESKIDTFSFLKNFDVICTTPEQAAQGYDLFIVMDCASSSRLGPFEPLFQSAPVRLCVDHHMNNNIDVADKKADPAASSTCELLYDLIPPERITREIAECLYVGIITDTGVFQYSCTSPSTMTTAGKLMKYGIDYPTIVQRTFFEKTYPQLRMLGYSISKSVLHNDGRIISCVISQEEMDKYGAGVDDMDGIASEMRNTRGVEVSVFLYQNPDHTYKLSLRSGSYVDVAAIASKLGGGGHVRAAGATIYDPPQAALKQIVDMVQTEIDRYDADNRNEQHV